MKKQIVIGSRGSRLAEIQARSVMKKLGDFYPDVSFSLSKIVTRGDLKKTSPLPQIPGYGFFVKELEEALLEGRIDIAVHSLKDLPFQTPEALLLAAVTQRLDPRDVLISRRHNLEDLPAGAVVGTGSLRRTVQLHACRSDVEVRAIRGNIDTRLRKVSDGGVDAVIIAAAAMIRLGWQDEITEYLSLEHFLPQAGQGALGIEIRSEDEEILKLVRPLHHEPTAQCVGAERALVRALGGGCSSATAALGMVDGSKLKLRGMVTGKGGITYAAEDGSPLNPEEVALRLAEKLKGMSEG